MNSEENSKAGLGMREVGGSGFTSFLSSIERELERSGVANPQKEIDYWMSSLKETYRLHGERRDPKEIVEYLTGSVAQAGKKRGAEIRVAQLENIIAYYTKEGIGRTGKLTPTAKRKIEEAESKLSVIYAEYPDLKKSNGQAKNHSMNKSATTVDGITSKDWKNPPDPLEYHARHAWTQADEGALRSIMDRVRSATAHGEGKFTIADMKKVAQHFGVQVKPGMSKTELGEAIVMAAGGRIAEAPAEDLKRRLDHIAVANAASQQRHGTAAPVYRDRLLNNVAGLLKLNHDPKWEEASAKGNSAYFRTIFNQLEDAVKGEPSPFNVGKDHIAAALQALADDGYGHLKPHELTDYLEGRLKPELSGIKPTGERYYLKPGRSPSKPRQWFPKSVPPSIHSQDYGIAEVMEERHGRLLSFPWYLHLLGETLEHLAIAPEDVAGLHRALAVADAAYKEQPLPEVLLPLAKSIRRKSMGEYEARKEFMIKWGRTWQDAPPLDHFSRSFDPKGELTWSGTWRDSEGTEWEIDGKGSRVTFFMAKKSVAKSLTARGVVLSKSVESMMQQLAGGKRVHVQTEEGTKFWIEPKHESGMHGYAVIPEGGKRRVTPHRLLSKADLYNWLSSLEELKSKAPDS